MDHSCLVSCFVSMRDTQLLKDNLSMIMSQCYSEGFQVLASSLHVLSSHSKPEHRLIFKVPRHMSNSLEECVLCKPGAVNPGTTQEHIWMSQSFQEKNKHCKELQEERNK